MELSYKKCQELPIVIIDDFYNKEELHLIWGEIQFLSHVRKLKDPEFTGSGSHLNDSGELEYKKKNIGICLDHSYSDRNISDILTLNRKVFDKDFRFQLCNLHAIFRFINKTNRDITKIHYFSNEDCYLDHDDDSVISIVTYFHKEPKAYSGGDLVFEEDVIVEPKNNRVVIFPSILRHAVTPVLLDSKVEFNGRYAMSQFLYVESK